MLSATPDPQLKNPATRQTSRIFFLVLFKEKHSSGLVTHAQSLSSWEFIIAGFICQRRICFIAELTKLKLNAAN